MVYPVYDGIPGKTVSGIHELGGVEGVEGFRALVADGWLAPVKFVGVDAYYAVACASVLHPDAICEYRYYAYRGCNSDDMPGWMGSDPPAQSAVRWVQHLSPEFDVLYNSGRVWYVEAFNEQGINQQQAEFYLEAATELQRRYGDKIRIAAISMSAGTYNEEHTLRTIAEHFLVPAEQRGLKYALSLHAYANWLAITDIPGLPLSLGMDINWDAIPDYDINAPRDPRHWTLFALGDAFKFWWQEYGIKPPTIVSEIDIDRMPPPVEGHINGGMWEGYRNGAYDRQTAKGIPIDELFARNMWFIERVLRAINRGGGNILSAHWFTHFDANAFSRWALDYFHRGSVTNLFKYYARNAEPSPPNQPDFSNVTYCALATKTLTRVNYRSKPDASDPGLILGQLSPYEIYKIDSYARDSDGGIWYRTAIALNTFAWVASWVVQTSDHCNDLPEWKETPSMKKIGGSWTDFGADKIGGTLDRVKVAVTRHVGWSSRSVPFTGKVPYYLEGHWFQTSLDGDPPGELNNTPDSWTAARNYFAARPDEWRDEHGDSVTLGQKWAMEWVNWTDLGSLYGRGNVYYMAYWSSAFNPDHVKTYIEFERARMERLQRTGQKACTVNVYLDQFTSQYRSLVQSLLLDTIRSTGSALGIGIRGSLESIADQIRSLETIASWNVPVFVYEIQPDDYPNDFGEWLAHWNYLLNQQVHVRGACVFAWHSDGWHSEWSGKPLDEYLISEELPEPPTSKPEPPAEPPTDPANGCPPLSWLAQFMR